MESDEGDPGTRRVDLPYIEPLILIQASLKLVRSEPLGQDLLTSIIKPDWQTIKRKSQLILHVHYMYSTVIG